jgi:hypothetical protein
MKKCRCTSTQHGHPNPCGKEATEADQLCKVCHDKAANEMHKTRSMGSEYVPRK